MNGLFKILVMPSCGLMKQREIIKCCPDCIKENIGEKGGGGGQKRKKKEVIQLQGKEKREIGKGM